MQRGVSLTRCELNPWGFVSQKKFIEKKLRFRRFLDPNVQALKRSLPSHSLQMRTRSNFVPCWVGRTGWLGWSLSAFWGARMAPYIFICTKYTLSYPRHEWPWLSSVILRGSTETHWAGRGFLRLRQFIEISRNSPVDPIWSTIFLVSI